MEQLKQRLQDFCGQRNIDILGFASKERFNGLDEKYNPFTIFPEAKTVIMLGKRICRGTMRGVEEGTNLNDYYLFGNLWLEDNILTIACYDMTRIIEDEGYEAVPIFPNPTEVLAQGVPVADGKVAPNVHPDFTYSAVAAGVAEISYSGFLFTPEFGSRQRFHMIITDAEFEPTPILKSSVCDNCGKCADACPLGAISKTDYDIIDICGKKMKVARIDYAKCVHCKNGVKLNRFISGGKPDRIAALCNRTCICHLEEKGLVKNIFKNKFRQNKAWALDIDGNYVTDKEGIE